MSAPESSEQHETAGMTDSAHPDDATAPTVSRPAQRVDLVATVGRWAPLMIAVYILSLAALRLELSPFLAPAEAAFFGAVDFRLVYENSHPPLYNWLLRIALEATGWDWPMANAVLRYGLLATFHLLVWDTARRISGDRAAALAVAASAFMPQIVWMSAHSLSHSLMVMVGVAATIHATVLVLLERRRRAYLWFGVALALGSLAKYNFFFFVAPFIAALWLSPLVRGHFFSRRIWVSAAAYAAMVLPILVASALEFSTSTARVSKLYSDDSWVRAIDLPYVGVDGFASLIVATLAWLAPAAVIWAVARVFDRQDPPPVDPAIAEFAQVIMRTMAIGVGVMALVVLAADMSRVHERYLTPVLAVAAVYVAIAWPVRRAAPALLALAAATYLAVLPGFWAMVTYGQHRFVYPYDEIASVIRRHNPEPVALIAPRRVDVANMTLALGWPAARAPEGQPLGDAAVVLWRGRGDMPESLPPAGFGPASAIFSVNAPIQGRRDETVVFQFQAFERIDAPR